MRVSEAVTGTPSDVSNAVFTIAPQVITVTTPNGEERLIVDSTYHITWSNICFTDSVKIEYSTNSGFNWITIISRTNNDSIHPWTVPNTPSSNCLARISDCVDGVPADTSDGIFTIAPYAEEDSIHLAYGWNMVSLPSLPLYSPIPRDSIFDWLPIFAYDCNVRDYYIPQHLNERKGYWVARTTSSDTFVTYLGTCVSCYTETLCYGWNMIGATCEPVPFSNVSQSPQGCIIPYTLHWWDPDSLDYIRQDTLKPARGYWVAAIGPCTLTVCNPQLTSLIAVTEAEQTLGELLWIASITATGDSDQEIHVMREFGTSANATKGFDFDLDLILPPPPIEELPLDAYFQNDGVFKRFARDVRGVNEVQTWSLIVESKSGFS
ncbi:MAG: hypothetical protein AB1589_45380, partial [Cyanobacteriota bacterium]